MAKPTAPKSFETPEDFGAKVKAHVQYRTSDGQIVPGGSTIGGLIKDGDNLTSWANRMGLQGINTRAYTEETAAIGTLAHAMIEHSFQIGEPGCNANVCLEFFDTRDYSENQLTRATWAYNSFARWAAEQTFEDYQVEMQLVSDEYRFGGTIDFYGRVNGRWTQLDYKTSKSIYMGHVLQSCGYAKLIKSKGLPLERVNLVKIGRAEDSYVEIKPLTLTQLKIGWEIFEKSVEIYQLKRDFTY